MNTDLDERVIDLSASPPDVLTNKILSMHKNYVDELVEISKVSKILTQDEKKSFRSIDKLLGIKPIETQPKRPRRGYPQHSNHRPGGGY